MASKSKPSGTAEFLNASEFIAERVDTITVSESYVSSFPSAPSDPTGAQALGLMEQSSTLDFWTEEGEDIYTHDDGQQI